MARSTRLYTLCVILLLAFQPSTTLAGSTSRLERVKRPFPQLDRRQGLEGIFGGRGTAGDTTTDTTTVATTSAVTGTTVGSVNPIQSSSNPSSSPTSTPVGIGGLPLFGSSTASSTSTNTVPVSLSVPTSATSETSATSGTTSAVPTEETSSASQIIVTVTSIVTNADGSQSTMVSASASAVAKNDDSGSGPSGKTWGIIGGVVGGVAILIGAILVIWRCTQRRFDNLDGDIDEIKWPELQPDGQTVSAGLSTLNPAATRRTGGAGFEMEKDDASEWGDESPRLGVRPGANESQYFDQTPYEVAYSGNAGVGNANGGGAGSQRGSYYDPYLGQAASPYPSPPNIAYPPSISSPYGQYAGAVSNNSFHDSRIYESTDDVPLTGQSSQHPLEHYDSAPGYPIVRVSSPASQHRM